MPIQVSCPACGRALRVPDALVGQRVKCPDCLENFVADAGAGTDDPLSLPPPAGREETFRAADAPPRPAPDARPPDRPRDGPLPRPRLDDDDYDEDDDDLAEERLRDRRRRRRGPDVEAVRAQVAGPALAMMVLGGLGGLLTLTWIALILGGGGSWNAASAMQTGIVMALSLATSALMVVGGFKMRNLEAYGLAKAAAIIAIIPCTSPCCLLSMPFGIWALNVLNEPDVKRAFTT